MKMAVSVKRILLGAFWRLDEMLPRSLGIWVRNRCFPWRPVLDTVELHLADTCNLNCRGCLHFSPYCKPHFAGTAEVEGELRLLLSKFAAVRHVHLLGGEPLLNGHCAEILRAVRRMCPQTRLSLVTNGLLLLKQDDAFWTAARETRTMLDMTHYPVMDAMTVEEIGRKCLAEGVLLRVTVCSGFLDKILPEGTADPREAFRTCRRSQYCPYLRGGRLYPCATAYHVADGLIGVARDPGISLKDSSARAILIYLQTPSAVCRHCRGNPPLVDWRKI